jgi:hypothetical protein
MAERKDLDERHEELIAKIEALYYIHKSKIWCEFIMNSLQN